MANVNMVILIGNVTRDIELKYLPSQTAVAEFGLAVNRTWKDGDGNKKEEVTFVDCSVFGKAAEVINQYVKKGNPIFVEGRLKLDTWDAKDGTKRSKLRVVVENFQFLNAGRSEDQGEYQGEPAKQATPKPTPARPSNLRPRNQPADASMRQSAASKILDHPSDNDLLEDAELPF